ncbi:MAG: hypothetical protein OMM_08362, partial [Candidatus Magnetoglobus multicellularis str. Araruama]
YKTIFHVHHFKIKGQEPLRTGQCNQCGQCCQSFRVKSNNQWIQTEKQFKRLIQQKPEYSRLICRGKTDGYLYFTCSWLTSDGICKDHQNRLQICKEYPSSTRFYTGNKLPDYCGYSIEAAVPFHSVLNKQLKKGESNAVNGIYSI